MRFFTLSILFLFNTLLLHANAEIIFEESGKQGLKDDRGEVLIPAKFDQLGWSNGEVYVMDDVIGYRKNGKWGLIAVSNEIITAPVYQEIVPWKNHQFIAKRPDPALRFIPSGIIDVDGGDVIPFKFLHLTPAGENLIVKSFTESGIRFGLITGKNKVILPLQFAEIRYLGIERFAIRNDLGKWAIFNQQGKPLSAFMADRIEVFKEKFAKAYRSGAVGLLDQNGKWIIEPRYARIDVDKESADVLPFAEWDILTEQNTKLHSVAFDSVLPWQQQYWKVIANGHEWIVDKEFNAVTPSTYEHIDWLNEQLMVFSEEDKYGIIRFSGEKLIPARYDTLFSLNGRIYAFQNTGVNRGWNLFGLDGKRVTPFSYQRMYPEQASGLIPVKRNMKWGMLNTEGKEVISCSYDSVGSSIPGMISIELKGESGIIDEEGSWLMSPLKGHITLINKDYYLLKNDGVTYLKHMKNGTVYFSRNPVEVKDGYLIEKRDNNSFWKINLSGQILNDSRHHEYEEIRLESEGFIAIKMNGKYGFIDREDRLRIANRYDNVSDFHEGLAGFKLLNHWGFLDKYERIVVQPRFDEISEFNNGLCIVSKNNMKGVIDTNGAWVIKPEYEEVYLLENGRYKITKNGRTGLLDENGRIIVSPRYDDIEDLAKGQVIVRRQDKYGLVSRRGDDLIPIVYDQLLFDPYNQCYLGMKKVISETVPLR